MARSSSSSPEPDRLRRRGGGGRPTAPPGALPEPFDLLRPGRVILGVSAVLVPFTASGDIDWPTFRDLLGRTTAAGLVPAVNMDTGYVDLLTPQQRREVLVVARAETAGPASELGGTFVAGAFVGDRPGDPFDVATTVSVAAEIAEHGGVPVIFPSYGLGGLGDGDLVDAFGRLGGELDAFVGFELSPVFAPFGRIFSLDVYRELLAVPACVGAKHSSLDRQQEWARLRLRDAARPEFRVFTGNDLAIDLVMYGSDYLLGLSAFAPDAFAERDRRWAAGDPGFHQLNDVLQYLGAFAFRAPVPAYKHTAAQFLHLRGWLPTAEPHPQGRRRPDSDIEVLRGILDRLEAALAGTGPGPTS